MAGYLRLQKGGMSDFDEVSIKFFDKYFRSFTRSSFCRLIDIYSFPWNMHLVWSIIPHAPTITLRKEKEKEKEKEFILHPYFPRN